MDLLLIVADKVPLETTEEEIYGVMNNLFVSDLDKRKSFCLQIKACARFPLAYDVFRIFITGVLR